MLFYSKINNSKMGDNSDKEKKLPVTYFFMRNPYMEFQTLAYMVLNFCYAHESNKVTP